MVVQTTEQETVVFDDQGRRLGHYRRSGRMWVVKVEGLPLVLHEKSPVLAEESLLRMLRSAPPKQ